jgi:hypothetical protein
MSGYTTIKKGDLWLGLAIAFLIGVIVGIIVGGLTGPMPLASQPSLTAAPAPRVEVQLSRLPAPEMPLIEIR